MNKLSSTWKEWLKLLKILQQRLVVSNGRTTRKVENGERPIPKEMEESIRDVFTFAYATGIATGVEDTIVSYNIMFNTGKGGEA